jgi:alpha,alpha-trehalose phosphorylase
VDSETIKNSFNYYEKITTHDSSLSSCIYGIVASRCGFKEKAYDYFRDTVNLDLIDAYGNTKDGLHMASIAGTILSVVSGFAGLKVNEYGLSLSSNLPDAWKEISFKIKYRGRTLQVNIGKDIKIEILEGDPLKVNLNGKTHILGIDKNKFKAFVFDLDGVLTDTSSKHYEAWNELSMSLGHELPAFFEDELRGISRIDSLEKILEYFGLKDKYSEREKIDLATKKNNIYIDKISNYSKENLFEGVLELLDLLKENGFKIALASASKSGEFLLKSMNIYNYFDAVVDPSSINNGKPAPDIFLNACEKINVNPEEAIGVEDAFSGIESIKAAGLLPIGFGKSKVLNNCEITVRSLNEIIEAINCYKKITKPE